MGNGSSIEYLTGSTGRWILSKITRTIDQAAFFWLCLRATFQYRAFGRRIMSRIIINQIYFTGVQSVGLIAALALVIGALVVTQGITQLMKVGSLDELGLMINVILIRELAPLLTAIVITLRSGSAIAMEIGYMNVLGEIEALEMQGVSTIHFLAVPRLIAVSVSVICLMIFFVTVSVAGGFFAAWSIGGVSVWSYTYNLASIISRADFALVVFKGVCFGVTIPVICLYNGYMAEGAITNVPPRVSLALVDCLIYCVVLNIIVTAAFPL